MEMFEKILERRLRKLITVNNMQCGFIPGKCTTDGGIYRITTARKTHISAHGFVLYLRRFGKGVPGDLVYWCLRRGGSQRS